MKKTNINLNAKFIKGVTMVKGFLGYMNIESFNLLNRGNISSLG